VIKDNVREQRDSKVTTSQNDFRTHWVIQWNDTSKDVVHFFTWDKQNRVKYIAIQSIKPINFENKKLLLRENTTT